MSHALSTNLITSMVFWLGDFVKFSLISPFIVEKTTWVLTPPLDGRSTSMPPVVTAL